MSTRPGEAVDQYRPDDLGGGGLREACDPLLVDHPFPESDPVWELVSDVRVLLHRLGVAAPHGRSPVHQDGSGRVSYDNVVGVVAETPVEISIVEGIDCCLRDLAWLHGPPLTPVGKQILTQGSLGAARPLGGRNVVRIRLPRSARSADPDDPARGASANTAQGSATAPRD